MNIKKIFLMLACVVASSFSASCAGADKTGLDFTFVEFTSINMPLSVKFEYQGTNLDVYWSDGTQDSLNYHTFEPKAVRYFIAKGDIKNISFCDKDGNLLADGNSEISNIIFSNTINNIPSKAFYGINLYTALIPTSVSNIGDQAFYNETGGTTFYCGANNKPGGWSNSWDVNERLINKYKWGVNLYTEDDCLYVLATEAGAHSALASICYKEGDNLDITIKDSVSVGGTNYKVVAVLDYFSSLIWDKLKTVTIPNSVNRITGGSFEYCINLEEIKIDYANTNLEMIEDRAFYGCTKLNKVTIPKTVYYIGDEAFLKSGLTDVDVTGYTKPSEIATCSSAFAPKDGELTFHYTNTSGLEVKNFTDKGWPDEKVVEGQKVIEWTTEPMTSSSNI